jgi:hypothetical protein
MRRNGRPEMNGDDTWVKISLLINIKIKVIIDKCSEEYHSRPPWIAALERWSLLVRKLFVNCH